MKRQLSRRQGIFQSRLLRFSIWLIISSLALIPMAEADVTVRADGVHVVLSDTGVWQSLRADDGRELCAAEAKLPFAQIRTAQGQFSCNRASFQDGLLRLSFAETGTQLEYEVMPQEEWILFRLVRIQGQRPQSLTFCQIPVNITEKVGRRLNAAYDSEQAVCLLAANHQADCGASRSAGATILRAGTQDAPGPKMEGAACALIVCPTARLKNILWKASHAFGLLTNEDASGTPVKDTELPRGSYWFLTVSAEDAERVIEYCRLTGFKQVMISSGSWCRTVGHYTFNESRFPNEAALKAFVDKLHAAGILVGMHCFASKVSKTDAYVTPVPDKRFWVDRQDVLAEDITAEQTEIKVQGDLREWPGSPVASQKLWEGGVHKHQEVLIEDEIIQYESIGPEGVYNTFYGCKRGAWGTKAAAHKAGTLARHYGVDGCINGYIIDQETSLIEETTDRLAHIFNTCGFDMIYFDGGEDVDRRRFNYYVSKFQEIVMRKIKKRPIIHMGTIMTHLLWHSFARSGTVDVYLSTLYGAIQAGAQIEKWPTVREHINRSVDYMLSIREDLMPGELGWFGIWPKQKNTDGLQLDEMEYLMCKSLGYDAPISLETSFRQMEAHPLTPGLLEIVRLYEELRMKRLVEEATCQKLQQKDQDFALIVEGEQRHFVPVTPLENIAGGREIRGMIGDYGEGSVATLWHYIREADLIVPLAPAQVRVLDLGGQRVPIEEVGERGERVKLHVGNRRLALLANVPREELRKALEAAEAVHQPAQRLWLQAESGRLVGQMALGSQLGLRDESAYGDFVVCTGQPNPQQPQEWYAEYTVDIPHEGLWTLWARVRYPSGGDMSFGLWIPSEPLSLETGKVIGNCGQGGVERWHWTGRGGGSTSEIPGAPIPLYLPKGPFTFRVVAREGPGTAALNPRLDALLLTDDPEAEPPGEDIARAALEGQKP